MAKDYRDLRGNDSKSRDGKNKPKMEPWDRKNTKIRPEEVEDDDYDQDLDMYPSNYGWDDGMEIEIPEEDV